MKEYKSLQEWLDSHGNPRHSIEECEDGSMVVAIEDKKSFSPGITLYSFTETELPNGQKSFWIGSGWGIRKDYLPAIKDLLDKLEDEPEYAQPVLPAKYRIVTWYDDEEGEGEEIVDDIKAYTKAHAELVLRNGINSGKYPKGAWVEKDADTDKVSVELEGGAA